MHRTIETIGLTMLRWGSKRPVLLQRPPSWTVQYLRPLPADKPPINVAPIGHAGIWLMRRANPLSYVNSNGSAIKVTLP
jgi:hypothetical protein